MFKNMLVQTFMLMLLVDILASPIVLAQEKVRCPNPFSFGKAVDQILSDTSKVDHRLTLINSCFKNGENENFSLRAFVQEDTEALKDRKGVGKSRAQHAADLRNRKEVLKDYQGIDRIAQMKESPFTPKTFVDDYDKHVKTIEKQFDRVFKNSDKMDESTRKRKKAIFFRTLDRSVPKLVKTALAKSFDDKKKVSEFRKNSINEVKKALVEQKQMDKTLWALNDVALKAQQFFLTNPLDTSEHFPSEFYDLAKKWAKEGVSPDALGLAWAKARDTAIFQTLNYCVSSNPHVGIRNILQSKRFLDLFNGDKKLLLSFLMKDGRVRDWLKDGDNVYKDFDAFLKEFPEFADHPELKGIYQELKVGVIAENYLKNAKKSLKGWLDTKFNLLFKDKNHDTTQFANMMSKMMKEKNAKLFNELSKILPAEDLEKLKQMVADQSKKMKRNFENQIRWMKLNAKNKDERTLRDIYDKTVFSVLESAFDLVAVNIVSYGRFGLGMTKDLFTGNGLNIADNWNKGMELGGSMINWHREHLEDIGVGSYLGGDKHFAAQGYFDQYFESNPIIQGVNGSLDLVNTAYDDYQAWVYDVSRDEVKKLRQNDNFLYAGKLGFEASKIAVGTLVSAYAPGAGLGAKGTTLGKEALSAARNKLASRTLMTSAGFAGVTSYGHEAIRGADAGTGVDGGRLFDNFVNQFGNTSLTLGAISGGTRAIDKSAKFFHKAAPAIGGKGAVVYESWDGLNDAKHNIKVIKNSKEKPVLGVAALVGSSIFDIFGGKAKTSGIQDALDNAKANDNLKLENLEDTEVDNEFEDTGNEGLDEFFSAEQVPRFDKTLAMDQETTIVDFSNLSTQDNLLIDSFQKSKDKTKLPNLTDINSSNETVALNRDLEDVVGILKGKEADLADVNDRLEQLPQRKESYQNRIDQLEKQIAEVESRDLLESNSVRQEGVEFDLEEAKEYREEKLIAPKKEEIKALQERIANDEKNLNKEKEAIQKEVDNLNNIAVNTNNRIIEKAKKDLDARGIGYKVNNDGKVLTLSFDGTKSEKAGGKNYNDFLRKQKRIGANKKLVLTPLRLARNNNETGINRKTNEHYVQGVSLDNILTGDEKANINHELRHDVKNKDSIFRHKFKDNTKEQDFNEDFANNSHKDHETDENYTTAAEMVDNFKDLRDIVKSKDGDILEFKDGKDPIAYLNQLEATALQANSLSARDIKYTEMFAKKLKGKIEELNTGKGQKVNAPPKYTSGRQKNEVYAGSVYENIQDEIANSYVSKDTVKFIIRDPRDLTKVLYEYEHKFTDPNDIKLISEQIKLRQQNEKGLNDSNKNSQKMSPEVYQTLLAKMLVEQKRINLFAARQNSYSNIIVDLVQSVKNDIKAGKGFSKDKFNKISSAVNWARANTRVKMRTEDNNFIAGLDNEQENSLENYLTGNKPKDDSFQITKFSPSLIHNSIRKKYKVPQIHDYDPSRKKDDPYGRPDLIDQFKHVKKIVFDKDGEITPSYTGSRKSQRSENAAGSGLKLKGQADQAAGPQLTIKGQANQASGGNLKLKSQGTPEDTQDNSEETEAPKRKRSNRPVPNIGPSKVALGVPMSVKKENRAQWIKEKSVSLSKEALNNEHSAFTGSKQAKTYEQGSLKHAVITMSNLEHHRHNPDVKESKIIADANNAVTTTKKLMEKRGIEVEEKSRKVKDENGKEVDAKYLVIKDKNFKQAQQDGPKSDPFFQYRKDNKLKLIGDLMEKNGVNEIVYDPYVLAKANADSAFSRSNRTVNLGNQNTLALLTDANKIHEDILLTDFRSAEIFDGGEKGKSSIYNASYFNDYATYNPDFKTETLEYGHGKDQLLNLANKAHDLTQRMKDRIKLYNYQDKQDLVKDNKDREKIYYEVADDINKISSEVKKLNRTAAKVVYQSQEFVDTLDKNIKELKNNPKADLEKMGIQVDKVNRRVVVYDSHGRALMYDVTDKKMLKDMQNDNLKPVDILQEMRRDEHKTNYVAYHLAKNAKQFLNNTLRTGEWNNGQGINSFKDYNRFITEFSPEMNNLKELANPVFKENEGSSPHMKNYYPHVPAYRFDFNARLTNPSKVKDDIYFGESEFNNLGETQQ